MKEYFYKKEYKYMYLAKFFYNFANTLLETFGTVMLYKNGVPIWLILLIYGLRFGITGFCTPLFITISRKFGIAKCVLISNTFSIITSYFMINSENIYQNIIIFILAFGFMGLSNPTADALSSKYVDTKHRGRFNSFLNLTKILATVLASCMVAWGVISNSNMVLFTIIAIFFLLEYIFTLKLDYKIENKTNAFTATLKYLSKSKNKFKIIYALRTSHIIERLFLPLYLFIALKDFALFSSVITISLILQIATITLIGKYTDKNITKSNNLVTTIRAIITSIFLFTKNKVVISFNKTLSDNFEKVYETSIQTSIQNIIKESKESNELLSAVGQMSLCFTEVIIFAILALLSSFIGEQVFIIIFILSIVSTIFININIKEEESKS
ncbi:MAG: MFS transporter [Clostridia bacterium]